ncbi:MAG: cytochrome c [Bacteroidota bacterium]|jgi:cytochrome c551/c552|nr:cytochrome c [Bacteroidota bacterium]
MKKMILIVSLALFFTACGNSGNTDSNNSTEPATTKDSAESGNSSYDPNLGEGKFHDVQLSDKLDTTMANKGEKIAQVKCIACHKMTDEKLIGPGWAGVTSRFKPEWIMNFLTNTDVMANKDPKIQAFINSGMIRMPNPNLSDDEARDILEFMRKNDGLK